MAAESTVAEKPRTRAEIEAEIAAARERLAENLSELINQVHPRAMLRNTTAEAKAFIGGGFGELKDQLVDADGVRVGRVALALAAGAGVVTFALVVRSIFNRR